jgi:hypothetical protein
MAILKLKFLFTCTGIYGQGRLNQTLIDLALEVP